MARHKRAYNFDPDAVGKVCRRLEADRSAAEPSDEDRARSVLDGLPNWLVMDNWRWMPGYRRSARPRQRQQ